MRFVLCTFFMLVIFSVQAADLTALMKQAESNPQAQLEAHAKQPVRTALEHFLLAYSHYVLNNKEAILEFSNKAMTLEPDSELAARTLLLQALTYGVFYRDTSMAIEKLKQAQAILSGRNDVAILSLRMDILESFAQAYNQSGNAELAMKAAKEGLALATQAADKPRLLDAMIMMGRLYLQRNNLSQAYQYFKAALPLASEIGDQRALASISMRLGMAYQKLGQHVLALQHFKQAEKLYREQDSHSAHINALINLGDSQLVLKQKDEAKASYAQALKQAKQSGDPHMLVSVYASLSELAMEQDDLDQAEELLMKAYQLANQVSAQSLKTETALFLVNVFIKKQQYSAARQLLNEAAPKPDELVTFLKVKYLALSAELAAIEQQWQQAYQLEKTANQLEVEQLNDTSKIQLDNLQSSLELQLQQEKQQQLHLTQQAKLKRWLLLSATCAVVLLLVLLFVLYRQKKNRPKALVQMPQWRGFTDLLLYHHKTKTQGHLLVIIPALTQVALKQGLQQVKADLATFRSVLEQSLFWVEQDQEFWLYCSSERQAVALQRQLLQNLPAHYQAHSALLGLHALLSEHIAEADIDALRELVWYSLHLAEQQGVQGAVQLSYQCHQQRPCAWQAEQLRKDLFNAISLGLMDVQANGVSLSAKLQQQLTEI